MNDLTLRDVTWFWGEGWALRARACACGNAPVEQGSNPGFPWQKNRGPEMGPLIFWLGERDSNPRWRSQSPQSYH